MQDPVETAPKSAIPKALTATLCAAPLMLGGCASLFDPYIDVPRNASFQQGDPFQSLQAAATGAETARQKANKNRTDYVVTRSVLNYGTFGAAAAGGVAALYGAHRDLILGLGVGAATGYSASTLFASNDIVTTYLDAGKALGCVVGRADTAIAAGKSLSTLTASGTGAYDQKAGDLAETLKDFKDSGTSAAVTDARAALAAYRTAVQNVQVFEAHDGDFAAKVNLAVKGITDVLNDRIDKNVPDAAAVLRAAEGIGKLGVAFVNIQPARNAESIGPRTATTKNVALLVAQTAEVKEITANIQKTITDATNGIGEIGAACILAQATPTVLTADQTAVTVSKDQTQTIPLKGGKPVITWSWQGEDPTTKGLDAAVFDRTVVLTGRSGLQAGGPYTLVLRDSQTVASEVKIAVTTK